MEQSWTIEKQEKKGTDVAVSARASGSRGWRDP